MSTLGLERRYNPVFTMSREAFIRHKRLEHLPRPPYFRQMERVNLEGGMPSARPLDAVRILQPHHFHAAAAGSTGADGRPSDASTGSIVIDTRPPEAFAGGHLPGAYNVWLEGLPVFAG
jgi:hydroxyacylglutathione hydrolase